MSLSFVVNDATEIRQLLNVTRLFEVFLSF